MISKFKLYITSVALALCCVSCLDKFPEDSIPFDKAIQTVKDVDLAVIGIYDAFKSSALYSGNLTLLPDLQTDFVYGVNGNTNVYGDIWRWKNILATNTDIEAVYGSLYMVINRCNFLLDRVDNVRKNVTNDEQLDKLDQCCGEAYFARALAYSELVKLFCKAYESDEDAANQLGVILTRHYGGDEAMKRASLKESYAFILEDLDRAEELLEIEEDYPGNLYDDNHSPYFNEYTVHALRARVSLYMKNWDDAIKYSTKVIESNRYRLSSCTNAITNGVSHYKYMWNNDFSTETIWQVGFTVTSYGGALGRIFANYDYVSLRPDYVPAEWVINLYDNNDLRVTTFFQNQTTSYGLTWPLLIKYFGNESFIENRILHVCMPKVFRLSEQYLIRAEAYVQKEQPEYGKAGTDISTLRLARYSTYGSGTTPMNKDNAMDIIEQERVKELYMEGFRLHDLKRWHKGFERKPQAQSLENGSSLKVEKDDVMFVWPIPQHELDAPGSIVEPNESNK
ncbi:RagB/SusD family nutrient uptake outer membrane protein [Bacteroides acidifaciens]|uniref:RagB/SusD family nutrient uptake outer membrane protein n=1 Tax=Bacteroides acidifaciens TaxID=85831 RepID=UPI00214A0517|nr:RagB/SusD family nutrient uptake outer membrane protein [Bacteroides acidifaciens]MCR2005204.1 RagB/SusD family nutrient uptake outer membrane protein [Bacteroides acidifaciens]